MNALMQLRIWIGIIVIGTLSVSCAASSEDDSTMADLVLLNGNVITVDGDFSYAEAFAIRDEEFIAVGSNEDVQDYIGNQTSIIDADGKTVIPGLIESHVQATAAARNEAVQPFLQLGSISEIQEWLQNEVQNRPAGEWIRLPRADVTRIREGRIPYPEELDAAAPEHPAVFIWQFADQQTQVLNSAAMEAAGITSQTSVPEGGRMYLDEDGEPTGVLENSGELTEEYLSIPEVSQEEHLFKLEELLGLYNKVGITSVYERNGSPEAYQLFNQLKQDGRLTTRVMVTINLSSDGTLEGTERVIRSLPLRYRDGDDWVHVGPLMIRADGGILYGTAFMQEPYGVDAAAFYGFEDPNNRGSLLIGDDELWNLLFTGHRMNWPMAVHVTGDAGVDAVLDVFDSLRESIPGSSDLRPTLIHAYFPNPEAAERVAELGVGVDTQTAWYYKDGDALSNVLGSERIEKFIGLRTWKDASVNIALNSDHMQGFDPNRSLNPYNPFLTMYTAITRKTEGGQVFGQHHQISREDAIRMMTIDAAWLNFEEERKGSIETGKLGDFAILSEDFLTCEEEKIREIHSQLTVVGGNIVYEAPGFTSRQR